MSESGIQADDGRAMGLNRLRESAVAALAEAGVPSPEADAELLIGHVLGISRGEVQAKVVTDAPLSSVEAAAIDEAIQRRSAREPLQHITGRAAFRSLELAVGPGAFVPRPETEFVTQLAIDALMAAPVTAAGPVAVDLGTGTGAIALAIATEVPYATVFAVEVSPEALTWAQRNFEHTAAGNARLAAADLADALPELDGGVDVVVSNPPYIPSQAIPRDPEVRLHDPEAALYGGADGLDVIRQVSATALRLLRPGGALVLEHGEQQGEAVRALLAADGWRAASTHRDLLARDRATTALRP